ncbi:MAG: rod-binding protein [Sphingobium sp.]
MTATPLSMVSKTGAAAVGVLGGSAPETREMQSLKKAAQAFEAVFIRQMLGEMRSSGFGDDLTGSSAVEQFQEMADAKTADTLSERGNFGIADMLVKQLAPRHAAAAYASGTAAQADATDSAAPLSAERKG